MTALACRADYIVVDHHDEFYPPLDRPLLHRALFCELALGHQGLHYATYRDLGGTLAEVWYPRGLGETR